jgi:hypothetical protein
MDSWEETEVFPEVRKETRRQAKTGKSRTTPRPRGETRIIRPARNTCPSLVLVLDRLRFRIDV